MVLAIDTGQVKVGCGIAKLDGLRGCVFRSQRHRTKSPCPACGDSDKIKNKNGRSQGKPPLTDRVGKRPGRTESTNPFMIPVCPETCWRIAEKHSTAGVEGVSDF